MHWKAGEPPKKSWMSCAAFWTSTRGEADDQHCELAIAGCSADARLDFASFPLARSRAGGTVCRGGCGLPKRLGALRAGSWRACIDADVAGRHIHVVADASESGR